MSKLVLPFVETMITYACNLSCDGCTNYSDYNTKGSVPWQQGSQWIASWLEKVDIPDFGLIGGEPLLNPEVKDWLYGCRELMPTSQIRFTTNALLLNRKLDVLDAVFDIGNCVFKITVHEPQEFYVQEAIKNIFALADWQPVVEHGIKRWAAHNNIRLQINFPTKFFKTFQGTYENMLPHSNDPALAFAACVQKTCPLLYKDRLYKCSSIALLNQTLDDWNQHSSAWQPYTEYLGIAPDCSRSELQEFVDNFGSPESICSMCPTAGDTASILDHTTTVIKKVDWIKKHATV